VTDSSGVFYGVMHVCAIQNAPEKVVTSRHERAKYVDVSYMYAAW